MTTGPPRAARCTRAPRGWPRAPHATPALVALPLAACQGPEAFLDTAGPDAESIAGLWWVMFALGGLVYLAVLALVGVPVWRAWRRRSAAGDEADDARVERRLLVGGGLIGTTAILFGLYLVSLPVLLAVSPQPGDADEITIEVVGHQFWWEVHYPDHGGIVTANEITIPAGEPVRFQLSSADVIHSFWIPRLHGKVDMTPGHTTELVLQADEPGHYRGRCTEYCGLAHAQMILHVFAEERDAFDAWVEEQVQPAPEPATEAELRGQEIFMTACAQCHPVRGQTPATDVGPDLTHLASREYLAAGIMPLTADNLAAWILEPRALKPGAPMPDTLLSDDDLADLLSYLEGLG